MAENSEEMPTPSVPQSLEEAEKALADKLAHDGGGDVVDAPGGKETPQDELDGLFGSEDREAETRLLESMSLNAEEESGDYRYVYKMNRPRRGLAIIINNKTFERRTQMNERTGTDVDAANLFDVLKNLGFDTQLFHNLSTTSMLRLLSQAAEADHSDADCFACAILSHGDQGIVYGTDGIIQVDSLVGPFKGDRCPGLAGKPKLFFIQACRGSQLDHGTEESDSKNANQTRVQRIPSEADFLMAYSTVPGYFSWRNSYKGSWFCQALCQELRAHASSKEIMWIMTRVNRVVAYDFESNASKASMNKKKQIPSIVSMLTKELYLKPKA